MNLLITAPEPTAAASLAEALRRAGLRLAGACACRHLVREAVRLAPEGVVLACPVLDADLLAQLRLLADGLPRPVLVASDGPVPDDTAALLAAQVWAWLPGDCPPDLLRRSLGLVQARWSAHQAADAALAGALARLDERKWVDRAKGVLMRHQQLSEADAFTLLRTASMHANLRVGEVSRGLIEAAQAADAVNRAGQLRMLSQRVVKALALRAGGGADAVAEACLADSLQRLRANLAVLRQLAPGEPAAGQLAAAVLAGERLQQQVRPADLATLAAADHQAEALLQAAEALTTALEAASGRRALQVVNLCGRQRMLSQRLAKQALLAGLLDGAAAQAQAEAAARTLAEFEQALADLTQAPLGSDEIRAGLAAARGQWRRMVQGMNRMQRGGAPAGRLALAEASEALLDRFEQLTSLVEHSMQVLLG